MKSKLHRCSKSADEPKNCIHCNNYCVKNGTVYGKQRYQCKSCKRSFVNVYTYKAYEKQANNFIKAHIKEGCGIRSIARLASISPKTVLKRIIAIAKTIIKPFILFGKEYELDELRTYVKKKTRLLWIVYAIRKDIQQVTDFAVGSRTGNTLKLVTDTLLLSQATKVYTDKLQLYNYLLPEEIHSTRQ
jgi:insertion element IS1 protein InsB